MVPPKPYNESERLAALRRYGILDTPPEAGFDDIARLIASICETPIAVINFIDADRQWFKSEVGLGVRETPLDTSICAYALLREHLQIIPDLQKDERFECNPFVCAGPQWRFYAGAQLTTDDNYALGTLCVLDFRPRELNERQEDALAILARQVVALLEARRSAVLREQAIVDARREIAQREQAEESLREVDRRKDQFLATLAHELRNPLAPIANALAIWPMVENDRDRIDKLREMMNRQVKQMTRLIDDLLDLSRINRDAIELRMQRADLNVVINGAIEAMRPFIEQQRQVLKVLLPETALWIEGDVARLLQVFGNLLNNATKYTPAGGVIWFTAGREQGNVIVRVRDDGFGIPEHMLTKIFDMFTQVDQTLERAQGGMGIGLTLCKRLVEMHGGSIEARSAGPGRGSEFIVRVPILAVEETAVDAANDGQPQTVAQTRRRVLVVDDAAVSADTLGMVLESLGHEARVAYDGPNALNAAREFNPEFVFLDIAMPGMNGYEVAKRLRAEPTLDGLALIALTGFGQEEDRRRALAAGFDHHLVKPVSIDSIGTLLADLSSRRAPTL